MSRVSRFVLAGFAAALMPMAALAQFPSVVLGFNDAPLGSAADSQEVFRVPQTSGTTSSYIVANDPDLFNQNSAFRVSGLQSEGAAALQVTFNWVDETDPNAWVRLTTIGGAGSPNPGLHTGGKVRFKISNRSELFFGEIGLVLGIRETGALVPQLSDGGTSGDIEWVGVDETVNGITAGADGIVDTTAAGDDVQVIAFGTDLNVSGDPLGTAVIAPGNNGIIDTVAAGDDEDRFGYFIDAAGARRPIPAVTLPTSGSPVAVEFDLATGDVTVGGSTTAAGITGFTGNGILDAANSRGTLEHIGITNVAADPAILIEFGLDELQVESPVADPVPAPFVQQPIVAGDTTVTVSGLNAANVSAVQLLVNGIADGAPFTTGLPAGSVDATLTSPAVAGDVITATQTAGGVTSAISNEVTVVASQPPFGFSILLDESGVGSTDAAGPWEFIGAIGRVNSFAPIGDLVVPDDANWQIIEIDLTDASKVQASLGGNGTIDLDPNSIFTFDSFWFPISSSIDPNRLGPYQVLIDGVEYFDPNGVFTGLGLNAEENAVEFGDDRGQATQQADTSQVSTGSFDGSSANLIEWTFDPNTTFNPGGTLSTLNVGVLQRFQFGFAGGVDLTENVPGDTATMRVRMLIRDIPTAPTIDLPVVQAPVVGAQSSVVVECDPNATSVQLFINGAAVGAPIDPNGASTVQFDSLPTVTGDSISAKQTIAAGTSDFAYPRAASAPLPPTIVAPVLANATTVSVSSVLTDALATASEVRLYANGAQIATVAGGTGTVVLNTAALTQGTLLTATQVVNGAESRDSTVVEVGTPPGPPTVDIPMLAGSLTVNLSNVNPAATLVTVYQETDPNVGPIAIGSIDPQGATTAVVPVSALVNASLISATASNLSGEGAFSVAQEVGQGNGDIFISMTIRETNTAANLGDNGGASGALEYVGASGSFTGSSFCCPIGQAVSPSANWQTITFDPQNDPVFPFAGGANGVVANAKGTLASLAITVDANSPNRSVGTYVLYIDNIINVGADNGANFVIEDFETATPGTSEYMFRVPGFSGSTSGLLNTDIANISEATAEQGNPGNSHKASWYFDDTEGSSWVRYTTFNSAQKPNPTIDLNFPVQMDILLLELLPPDAPSVVGPVVVGDTSVTVTDVLADATLVKVFANGIEIGSVDPNGADTVAVAVTPLVHLESITATQTATGGESGISNGIEVGRGNGNLLLSIGIRETGDAGALGTEGGTSGQIEWLGASAAVDGAPQGKSVGTSATWQTIVFDPNDPITGFTGDGSFQETRGVLEHLAVAADANSPTRSSGIYRLFVDNVINVGADGGNDLVIQDFDSASVFTQALFRNPGFSGSTDGDSIDTPDLSSVRDAFGNPGQSLLLSWFFLDTTAQRWQRVTTSGTAVSSRPIVDLTSPIQLDVLLLEPCLVDGDVNRDSVLDSGDIDPFFNAVAGPGNQMDPADICADLSGNDFIEIVDVALLQRIFGS